MTKDTIRKTLELVKTDKKSDVGNIIYDIPVFLDYLFGTVLRARYNIRWDFRLKFFVITLRSDQEFLYDPNTPHISKQYYLGSDYYTQANGELEEPGLSRFVDQLILVLTEEDKEEIDILLPMTKKFYEINFGEGIKIRVSDLEIVPYLLRRENNLLYSYKIRLIL